MRRAWRRIKAAFHRMHSELRDRLRRRNMERREITRFNREHMRGREYDNLNRTTLVMLHRVEDAERRFHHNNITRSIVHPRTVNYTDPRHIHKLARDNDLKHGVPPLLITNNSTRLIVHRYCRTSKPSYIHSVDALRREPNVTNWQGVYEAVNMRNVLHRPMVRSSRHADGDVERGGLAVLRTLLNMLKKRVGDVWTTIRKLVERIRSRLQRIRVIETVRGYFREFSLLELITRPSIVERVKSVALGFREWFSARIVRHCSIYTRLSGVPYGGPPSGWYYWKRRYSICKKYARDCDNYGRHSVSMLCNHYLAQIDPGYAEYAVQRLPEVIDPVKRVVCG